MAVRNRFSLLIGICLLSFWALPQPARAQYVKLGEVLTAGHEVMVSTAGSDSLIITYRPGSDISHKKVIPMVDSTYHWKPERAGIFSISTPNGPEQTVSVRFNSFPMPGLMVFLIAATILFGGAIFSSINLFGKP